MLNFLLNPSDFFRIVYAIENEVVTAKVISLDQFVISYELTDIILDDILEYFDTLDRPYPLLLDLSKVSTISFLAFTKIKSLTNRTFCDKVIAMAIIPPKDLVGVN